MHIKLPSNGVNSWYFFFIRMLDTYYLRHRRWWYCITFLCAHFRIFSNFFLCVCVCVSVLVHCRCFVTVFYFIIYIGHQHVFYIMAPDILLILSRSPLGRRFLLSPILHSIFCVSHTWLVMLRNTLQLSSVSRQDKGISILDCSSYATHFCCFYFQFDIMLVAIRSHSLSLFCLNSLIAENKNKIAGISSVVCLGVRWNYWKKNKQKSLFRYR